MSFKIRQGKLTESGTRQGMYIPKDYQHKPIGFRTAQMSIRIPEKLTRVLEEMAVASDYSSVNSFVQSVLWEIAVDELQSRLDEQRAQSAQHTLVKVA